MCLNMGKRCVVTGYSNSYKDGVTSFKFPTDQRLKSNEQDKLKELEPNGAVVANIRVFVAPSLVRTAKVGMKMKQMLKPKSVPRGVGAGPAGPAAAGPIFR